MLLAQSNLTVAMDASSLAILQHHCTSFFQELSTYGEFTEKAQLIDSKRIFHGRGHTYAGLEWCTIDAFLPALIITVYSSDYDKLLADFMDWLKLSLPNLISSIAIQRRDKPNAIYEWWFRKSFENNESTSEIFARWKGLRFKLNFSQQNCGFFLDIEPG
jgi:23S rRNA (cytosine1962-C5)-methyltransferase